MHTVTISKNGELFLRLEGPDAFPVTNNAAAIIGINRVELLEIEHDGGAMSVNGLEVDYTVSA